MNRNDDNILLYIARLSMLVGVIFTVFTFASNPFCRCFAIDSSVFAYIGRQMSHGQIPYLDIFDHKGPLLYLINWAGMSLGWGIPGVWILEVVGLVVSMFCLYRILKVNYGEVPTLLAIVSALAYFVNLHSGGNLTETYAFYLLLPCVTILSDACMRNLISQGRIFYVGFALGSILLLRPNMVAYAVPFGLWLIIDAVRCKDIKMFVVRCLWCIMGACTIILPILAWLGFNGALATMWNDYILFNFRYMAASPAVFDRPYDLPVAIVFVILNVALLLPRTKWRFVLSLNLVFQIVSLALIVPKMRYYHYYVPFVPACILPVAVLGVLVVSWKKWGLVALSFVQTFLLLRIALACGLSLFDYRVFKEYFIAPGRSQGGPLQFRHMDDIAGIKELTVLIDDKNSVQIMRNDCIVYLLYDLSSPWRYPYITAASIDESAREHIFSEIRAQSAKYIVVDEKRTPIDFVAAIRMEYELTGESNGIALYGVKRR